MQWLGSADHRKIQNNENVPRTLQRNPSIFKMAGLTPKTERQSPGSF